MYARYSMLSNLPTPPNPRAFTVLLTSGRKEQCLALFIHQLAEIGPVNAEEPEDSNGRPGWLMNSQEGHFLFFSFLLLEQLAHVGVSK